MAGKINYKTTVLNYLKNHPNESISREELIKNTNISKSRLSEILQSIRDDGYIVTTPPRSGTIRLDINADAETNILPSIKDYDIRQWLILFLLSKYEELTFRELLLKTIALKDCNYNQLNLLLDPNTAKKSYDNNHLIKSIRGNISSGDKEYSVAKDIVSVTALREDLNELRKNGLVIMSKSTHTTYKLSSAPLMMLLSKDSLYEFCMNYIETSSATSELEPLKQVYCKIKNLINYADEDTRKHRFGRINDISQLQIDTFNTFIANPYKTNQLILTNTNNGTISVKSFAVGLLYYSVETGCFYALGKNTIDDRIESRRLDRIEKIEVTNIPNTEFHNPDYYTIYHEMFSAHYEPQSYKVKVYFQDFNNVPQRFYDLSTVRSQSSIRLINNPPTDCPYKYVYEDTIRGLEDFARYLRSFGISVLAAEPKLLQDRMLSTYNRILEKYEEEYD